MRRSPPLAGQFARHGTGAAITASLNGGAETVDVNAAFATAIRRELFQNRGPLPRTLLDRFLDSPGYGVD